MIKINLAEVTNTKKKAAPIGAAAPRSSGSKTPILLFLIILGTLGGGVYWYMSLTGRAAEVAEQIVQTENQLKQLEAALKQDEIYEARKAALENRIKIIDGLKRNQVSPVVSLDFLAEAINRTQFVWLSSLDQSNATFSMSGTGTSVDAIADFVSNLEATGYFRNINLTRAQDERGNFTFSMSCDFSPPSARNPTLEKGAN
jgi:Tfp pilus assembly protein PilN